MVNLLITRTVSSLLSPRMLLNCSQLCRGNLLIFQSEFCLSIAKITTLTRFTTTLHHNDGLPVDIDNAKQRRHTMEDLVHVYSHHLSHLLKCAPSSGLVMISKNSKILKLFPEQLSRNISVLTSHFSLSEILEHPKLLSVPSLHSLEHNIQILKEFGFSSVTPDVVLNIKDFMKLSITTLKELHLVKDEVDPFEQMLQCLDCPLEVIDLIRSSHAYVIATNPSIGSIKESIVNCYLSWKLGETGGMKKPRTLLRAKYISIKYLVDMLKCLQTDFGFDSTKIYSPKSLLHLTPNHLRNIFTNVPMLAGMDIKTLANQYPKLLFTPAEDLKVIEQVLLDYGITNTQMHMCLAIFQLNPRQVRYRLNLLSSVKGFEVWIKTRRFLQVLISFDETHEQLKMLKDRDMLSLDVLMLQSAYSASSTLSFNNHLKKAKQAVSFLSEVLKKSEAEIRENLSQHPNTRNLCMYNIKGVIDALTELDVTKEQIWLGLPLVLYDRDVVQEQLRLMPQCPQAHPYEFWKVHPNFLQLVIYCLEKHCQFTGDAVYYNCTKEFLSEAA